MRKFLLTASLLLAGAVAMQAQSSEDWTVGEDISQFLDWGDYDGTSNEGGYWQGTGAAFSANEWEIFQGSDVDRYQMVYLPAGVYRFRCQGFYRDGSNGQAAENYFAGKSSKNAVLYVETGNYVETGVEEELEEVFVPNKTFSTPMMSQWATGNTEHLYETTEWTNDASYTFDGVEYWAPNCMDGTRVYFDHGFYDENTVQFYLMEDGFVKLGLRKPGANLGSDWLIFTNFRIIFQGDANEGVELMALQEEVAEYYHKLEDLEDKLEGGMIYTLISDARMEFDNEYGNIDGMSKEECLAAIPVIQSIYEEAVQAQAACEQLAAIVAVMENLYNSTDYAGKAAFGVAVQNAKNYLDPDYELGETDNFGTFQQVYDELCAARVTYLLSQEPVNGAYNFSSTINYPFFCNNEYTPTWNEEEGCYKYTEDIENTWVVTYGEKSVKEVMGEHPDWIDIAGDVTWSPKGGVKGEWIFNHNIQSGWMGGIENVTMQHGFTAVGAWSGDPCGGYQEMRQTITGLPAGYYAMGALYINAGNPPHEGQFVYINAGSEPDDETMEKAQFTHKGEHWWWGTDNVHLWRTDDWESLRTNMIYVGEEGEVTIGSRSTWFYAVTGFQLYYYGENPDFTALVAPSLQAAQANAEQLTWPGDRAAVAAILAQVPATIDSQEAYQAALATIADANTYVATATSVINNWKALDNFSELAAQQPEGSAEADIVMTAWMRTLTLGDEDSNDTYLDAIEADKDYAAYVAYLDYRAAMGNYFSVQSVATLIVEQNQYLTDNYANAAKLAELKAELAAPYNKAFLASHGMDKASKENPVDVTALIINPKFDELSKGWDGEMTVDSLGTVERWNCNFDISQTIFALPAGCYQIKVQALYRDAGDATTSYNYWEYEIGEAPEFWEKGNAKLYANAWESTVVSIASEKFEDQSYTAYVSGWQKAEEGDEQGNDVWEPIWVYQSDAEEGKENDYPWDTKIDDLGDIYYYPASLRGVSRRFAKNPEAYVNTVAAVVEEGGSLTFGLRKDTLIGGDWCAFDNFQLFYLGQDVPDAIDGVASSTNNASEYYSVSGVRQNGAQKGLNIVRMSNGQVKKVFIK